MQVSPVELIAFSGQDSLNTKLFQMPANTCWVKYAVPNMKNFLRAMRIFLKAVNHMVKFPTKDRRDKGEPVIMNL